MAGIATCPIRQLVCHGVGHGQAHVTESALGVAQGPGQQGANVTGGELFQSKQRHPAHQWRVDLEEWVLGGGTYENQGSIFDSREKGVLLVLGEPVDLVQEEDGPALLLGQPLPRRGEDSANVPDARRCGGESFEMGIGTGGDQSGEGRLPRSRWSPEEHRYRPARLDESSERCVVG